MTWIFRSRQTYPSRHGDSRVGGGALPRCRKVSRQGEKGGGRRAGETAAGKRGRHRRLTHDSSGIPQQLNGKRSGWGLLASAEKLAPAQWGMANPSPDVEVDRAETLSLAWKAAPLQLRGRAASSASCGAPEAFLSGSPGPW